MGDTQLAAKVAVVTGDVTMDWHLARRQRSNNGTTAWNPYDWARISWQRGGAALLADLIEAVVQTLPDAGGGWAVRQTAAPHAPIQPSDERFHHSYATWSPFKHSPKAPADKLAWRVEGFLGIDGNAAREAADWQRVVDDDAGAEVVVLDDANLGFRDHRQLWPLALGDRRRRPWVVVKLAWPVAHGPLWEHLQQHYAGRLIAVTTVNDLRQTEVQISRGLSWERTAQDIAWELVHNPRVNSFARCAHVVLSFGPAGAMLLSRREAAPREGGVPTLAPRCSLLYDPKAIEGQWERDYPGYMIGYTTCLIAGIVRQLLRSPERPDIAAGVQAGLVAMRALHVEGYGERGEAATFRLAFPLRLIAAGLAGAGAPFAVAAVQNPERFLVQPAREGERLQESGYWTILHDRYSGSLAQVARQIVLEGAEAALQGVPLGQFGGLLTVDRREIESFRSIRALVSEYCRGGRQKRPLSIAVFGAPGSGKSFGITQVAKSLLPGQIEVLEFNLSQFGSPDDLTAALHRVRDVSLGGQIPLVFWDEFDTRLRDQRLGWLRYFLAPMQDGVFREGQTLHPIGTAIFVFAGGTSHRLEGFGQGLDQDELRNTKVPDFVSRLKGYVNVLGPDPQPGVDDPYFIVRRAILLRSILQRNVARLLHREGNKELLSIDSGVLRAFLETRAYRHGARSMEAIVAMSMLGGKTAFERSSLPSEAQLDLHVNGREFLALVQQIVLEGDLLERLAAAAHELFCEHMVAQGYHWGPENSEKLKTHSSLRPYAELPDDEREQNRGTVRDIPHKLALAGYIMLPARSNERPLEFPGDALEMLAEREHERWVGAKLQDNWRYAPTTNKARKEHDCLVPWGELSELQKDKDRALVREIPRILARAGYAMVRLV